MSNVHNAERIIECQAGYYVSTAPWRIELPQGGVVRGGPKDVGTWPAAFDDLPANRRILRQGESGQGKVLEDNSGAIDEAIADYSSGIPAPPMHYDLPLPRDRGSSDNPFPGQPEPGSSLTDATAQGGGCGCRVGGRSNAGELLLALLGIGALAVRRRRAG